MLDTVGTQITASFPETEKLASVILNALSEEGASIGYGLLACSLTMSRLLNTGKAVSDEEEIKFIQSIMEWTGSYFTDGKVN